PVAPGNCLVAGTCYANGVPDPANECRGCVAATSQTAFSPLPSGTTCTRDAYSCTSDICDGSGTCTHPVAPGNCLVAGTCYANGVPDPTNECMGCVAAANQTAFTAFAAMTVCDDGNLCTTNDRCDGAGVCTGTPYTCSPGECQAASRCDGIGRCVVTNRPNGTPCADEGNACTDDACQAGICTHRPVPDATACSDGNLCTLDDQCLSGRCTGTPRVCGAPPASVCEDVFTSRVHDPAGYCVPASGDCAYPSRAIGCAACGGSCNPITGLCTTDPCCGVACDSPPATGCFASSGTCTDGACTYIGLPDGASCADGDACNGDEICRGGACTAGISLVCDDGNPCTTDTCDSLTGCRSEAVPDDLGCPDDGNVCTADACLGGMCVHPAAPDGLSCSSLTTCQGTCRSGACLGGVNCDDEDPCTIESCDELTGCVAPIAAPDGTPCPDGDVCNGEEICGSAACMEGRPLDCDDDNPCSMDNCDAIDGCVYGPEPDGTTCSTATICAGSCAGGACTGGIPVDCADDNPCTTDQCDETTFMCTNIPRPGRSCDDENVCTTDDVCDEYGRCTGQEATCDDLDPCTADSCDPGTGCVFTAVAEGADCDDGNPCTVDEACVAGNCVGGSEVSCDDDNPCTADHCDPTAGCLQTGTPGIACDDGDDLTVNDFCREDGTCAGASPAAPAGGCGCRAAGTSSRSGWWWAAGLMLAGAFPAISRRMRRRRIEPRAGRAGTCQDVARCARPRLPHLS
ncbi:MAG: hypothetical protein QME96_14345, partial [Myxococcota bacterium]|nr:hypothetical protein [Myxococcota bacterium]